MDVTATRHRVLAGNLANVDTPGYQRKDIDPAFKADLEKAILAGDIRSIHAMGPIAIAEEDGLGATRPDGNNVALDRELQLINGNALAFEATSQFVSGSLGRLKTAITGRTS